MEIAKYISDFENLPKQVQKQIIDYIKFFVAKYKKKNESDHSKKNEKEFFEICGLWEDRNINSDKLRKEAWRNSKW